MDFLSGRNPGVYIIRSLTFNSVKLNSHFDRLKLSSKTVRKFLFNESFCSDDELKSLHDMLFSKKHSVCVPIYFCILNLTFSLQDIIRW